MKQINPEWKDLKKGDTITVVASYQEYEDAHPFYNAERYRVVESKLTRLKIVYDGFDGDYSPLYLTESAYDQIFQPKCPSLEFEGELDDKIKESEKAAKEAINNAIGFVNHCRVAAEKEQRKRDLIDLAKNAPPMPSGYWHECSHEVSERELRRVIEQSDREIKDKSKINSMPEGNERRRLEIQERRKEVEQDKLDLEFEKELSSLHSSALKMWPVHYAKSVLQGIEADSDEMSKSK